MAYRGCIETSQVYRDNEVYREDTRAIYGLYMVVGLGVPSIGLTLGPFDSLVCLDLSTERASGQSGLSCGIFQTRSRRPD